MARVSSYAAVVWLGVALSLVGSASSLEQRRATPGRYSDRASALGVKFQYLSSHTSRKYLIETMGAGVALLDYDNDGKLTTTATRTSMSRPTGVTGSITTKATVRYCHPDIFPPIAPLVYRNEGGGRTSPITTTTAGRIC